MHVDKIGTRALGLFVLLKTWDFPIKILLHFMRKRILKTWQRIKILFFKNKIFLKIRVRYRICCIIFHHQNNLIKV